MADEAARESMLIKDKNVFQVILGEITHGDELDLLYQFARAEVGIGRATVRKGDKEPS